MQAAKWKLEAQAMSDTIIQRYSNFKKDGPDRKTPAYKKDKLKKLEEFWATFNEIDDKLAGAVEQIDDEYLSLRQKVETTYNKYHQALMNLPDQEDQQGNDDQNDRTPSVKDAITKGINSQKVRFTKIKENLDQLYAKIDMGEPMSKVFLNMKIKNLSIYWERISLANEELGSFGTAMPRHYIDEMNQVEEGYEEIMLILQEQLETMNKQKSSDVKVPRLVIPKFEGDYSEWVQFRDLFQSTILENESLTDAQRMQFLKTNIGGEAEKLISDLTISNVNFHSAWKRLIHRYENKRIIVVQYLTKIVTQPYMKNESTDSKQIKRILDTTDQALLALENLKRPVKYWDDWVVLTLSHKLNDTVRREWEKKIGDSAEPPKWECLKKFLEEEFRITENVEAATKRKMTKPGSQIKANQIIV